MNRYFYMLAIGLYAVCSCSPKEQTGAKAIAKAQQKLIPADSSVRAKQQSGVDLIATGNHPVAWRLEMDFEKAFIFTAADNTNISSTPVNATNLTDVAAESYITKSTNGPLNIIVYNQPCRVEPGTALSTKKVEVTVNNKRYSGCGDYLYDYRANDSWVLEFIDDEKQDASRFMKGLPRIELNLSKKKMYGSTGCNNVNADIEIKGDRILFSRFASTRMACPTDKAEKIFTDLISNHLVDYTIKEGRLVLYLINDSKLIFKKTD